ncbi:MAG: metal ABC transporter ATP-binding protein [Hyphomicrobiaceae bacterium]|nr:metal ABC transporter ATP-binding protein [Hyphomicrobiaceae bacterium]
MQERTQRPLERPVAASPAHEACAGHHDHGDGGAAASGAAPSALASLRGVSLAIGGRKILDGISLDIGAQEIVTVIGPNGAGKTTLIRVLLGLQAPDAGEIWRSEGLVVGYAPQRFDIDKSIPMTVARFVAMGRVSASNTDIADALKEVGAAKLEERQISELSGGELQRVILARAIVRKPALLILDEPVRGVDYSGEAELYTLIGALRSDHGMGVLLVSHDLHVVMAQSDRVICLNRHICCSGVPQSVAQHPEYARLFGSQTARALGVYLHHHDHRHDLSGVPEPARPRVAGRIPPE